MTKTLADLIKTANIVPNGMTSLTRGLNGSARTARGSLGSAPKPYTGMRGVEAAKKKALSATDMYGKYQDRFQQALKNKQARNPMVKL